jgi:hypothetical protein
VIEGIPDQVEKFRVMVTDRERGMEETVEVSVTGGKVKLTLDAMSFTSLFTDNQLPIATNR